MTDDKDNDPEKTPVPLPDAGEKTEDRAPTPRKRGRGLATLQLIQGMFGASDVPPPPDPDDAPTNGAPDLFEEPEQILTPAHVGLQVRVLLDVMVPVEGKLRSIGRVRPTFAVLKDALTPHKIAVEHLDEIERLRACEEDLTALLRAIDEALDDGDELPDGVREEHERIHRESRLGE